MRDDARRIAKFYRTILDRMHSGIAVFQPVRDSSGAIVDFEWVLANEYTARIVGDTEAGLIGTRLLEKFPHHTDSGVFDHYRRAMETGGPEEFVADYSDERISAVFNVSATQIGDGLAVAYVDITEEVRRRAAAETVRDRLEIATRAARIGVWEKDFATQTTTWDPVARAIYGVPPEETLSYDDWRAMVHPDDIAEVEAASRAMATAPRNTETESYSGRFRIVRRDGAIRHMQSHARIIESQGRRRIVGVNWDVTDEVEAAQELDLKRREAEAANVAKSQFLAVMSHEIRTPLNGMLGMTAVLEQSATSPRQRDLLRIVSEAGDELLEILNGILDLSRIESGQLTLETTTFDLDALLGRAAALFRGRAAEKGVTLEMEATANASGAAAGDPTRIRQILYNLLSNAVKFTLAGKILVRADVVTPASNGSDADELVLTVSDTGIGIAPDKLNHIFRPFTQADGSTTRLFGGAGLGLSIAAELARLMGGSIEVDSKLGEGSTFIARLPVTRLAAQPRQLGDEPRGAAAPTFAADAPLDVLVAEDHPTNQEVLRAMLSGASVSFTMVENGLEALKAWAARDYDLVLLDMQMPVMDGLSAAREMRRIEAETGRARTAIVAVTANAMAHHVAQCLAAGMDAHVAKPIRAGDLHSAIAAALALRPDAPATTAAGLN